jgi:hypothetical protein
MDQAWTVEIGELETLEAITQHEQTRDLLLRMATMSASGNLAPFLAELLADDEVDAETAGKLAELATDARFLHAVEEYVHRTAVIH